ncbi:bile acid:sodium symporter family protein [Novosphingobium album (ex Liu et al. 2023)]|uniref:Bile acid:sodium symporter n=1 Tax=Novosphingobium album (ex Liu et al. 2023) TaxID=3031130 RepID=A0ABT5WMN2_9SPHN|nr:bile acid:sodium symporter family protein [Novosphingobium album (ex Liu et al. 2023)]MDE8651307.1 bile acid:sodium symporter [Novosphingobium album (ex Liu et al. 2023)]
MRRPSFLPSVDPFLLWLISVVAAASLLPVRGAAAEAFGLLADLAIALLFFLHGAKLSRQAIVQGIGNWRLHGLVLASTYLLFPAAGLATARLAAGWINPLLVSGLLFLTLLPSTVQSSIAFTAMARGNVAAAVCSASLSNLLGILLTPLLVGLFLQTGKGGAGSDWQAVQSIVTQLLLPFLAGHFLRPLIGGFVDRNKKILMPVDRGSILLVVYSAFSAAVVNGIWHILDLSDLVVLLVLSAAILAVIMAVNVAAARLAGLSREDAVVLLFCGSKKSLVSGVPMAGALFAPAQVGMIVLPLMIFHQLQLFVCAWLAARFARQYDLAQAAAAPAGPDAAIPRTPAAIAAAAAVQGLAVPDACAPGVAANLDLLARHAERLRAAPEADGA